MSISEVYAALLAADACRRRDIRLSSRDSTTSASLYKCRQQIMVRRVSFLIMGCGNSGLCLQAPLTNTPDVYPVAIDHAKLKAVFEKALPPLTDSKSLAAR